MIAHQVLANDTPALETMFAIIPVFDFAGYIEGIMPGLFSSNVLRIREGRAPTRHLDQALHPGIEIVIGKGTGRRHKANNSKT